MKPLLLLTLCFCAVVAEGAASLLPPSLPAPKRPAAFSQLNNRDGVRRATAFLLVRSEGESIRTEYAAALEKVIKPLKEACEKQAKFYRPDQSYMDLRKDFDEWKAAAEAARIIVQTDHHKDAKKFGEMDKAFEKASRAFDRLTRRLKPGQPGSLGSLVDQARVVAEFERELSWCKGVGTDTTSIRIATPLETAGLHVDAVKLCREMEATVAQVQFNDHVTAAHSLIKWPKPEQVAYGNLLNQRRVILSLRPYLLAEKLSEACFQHSDEMIRLKYFAHDSPVPANKTPWDRVKNAGFDGNGAGECIYSGDGAASGAHKGWWYSDGHRLILYADGGNAQGIAKAGGGMWTFMNGSFNSFPL